VTDKKNEKPIAPRPATPSKVSAPASKVPISPAKATDKPIAKTSARSTPAQSSSTKTNAPASKTSAPIKSSAPAPKLIDRKATSAPAKTSAAGSKTTIAPKPPVSRSKKDFATTRPTASAPRTVVLPLFVREPERIGHMVHDRPAWIDEVIGIGFLIAGLVSFVSLFNTTPTATLASTWSETTRTFVGLGGAFILSIMIMGIGVLIILPKIGVRVRVRWQRIVYLEIAFAAFLALLHLLAHDPEPRALARAGQGGGYIGWALSELLIGLFGSNLAIFAYGFVLIVMLALAIGIQRVHVRQSLLWLRTRIDALVTVLTTPRPPRPRKVAATMQMAAPISADALPPVDTSVEPRRTSGAMARPMSGVTPAPAPITTTPLPIAPLPTAPAMQPPASALPKINTAATYKEVTPVSAPIDAEPTVPAIQPPAPISARESLVQRRPQTLAPRLEPQEVRHTRHFTVGDFQEVRATFNRSPELPPLTTLNEIELNRPSDQEINTNVRIIENTLLEFDIDVEVVDVKVGPTVTQYAVQPFREVTNEQGQVVMQRVRVNKIASLSGDLALALSAKTLRIQAYVPGHTYMGIEVPNRTPSVVAMRPVMESETFNKAFNRKDPENPGTTIDTPLAIPLGRDVSGAAFVADLATMPHLLIAGTTGSGKSVCITAMVVSLVMNNPPDRVGLVMLDPKMVELTRFNGLPHLLGPVETDMERIVGVLRWATREMDRRYKLLEVEAARNIEAYNRALGKRRKAEHLPYIVIVIDEIGDLMLSRPEEVERTITRLAQMARAVGMHLVIATQRPSVDIITGLIKANFPARISFAVASGIDSRVILDTVGAETLMGRGDMLYLASDAAGPQRLQGCFVSDEELDRVVNYWKQWQVDQVTSGESDPAGVAPWERGMTRRESLVETDPLLEDAIDLVIRAGEASSSQIQRQLGIDFPRASQIMDMLRELGVTGAVKEDGRSREVLLKPGTDRYKKLVAKRKTTR